MPHDDTPLESTYPPLEPPGEFISDIPDHLLKEASQADAFVMRQLSIARQSNEWCVRALVLTHQQVRTTNGRLKQAEAEIEVLKDDKRTITVGWKTIAKLVGGIVGFVSFVVMLYQAFQ